MATQDNHSTKPKSYGEYLALDQLLSCQHMKSAEAGNPQHDEHLFIIIHQVYELWFKQILLEIESVCNIIKDKFQEKLLATVVNRLHRVTQIQKLLIDQIGVLETMMPQDFMNFRDYLGTSSGFQSVQFRLLENKLGISPMNRTPYQNMTYKHHFLNESETKAIEQSELDSEENSLLKCVERWLERVPFLHTKDFEFWEVYRTAVAEMLNAEQRTLDERAKAGFLNEEELEKQKRDLDKTRNGFETLFDEDKHNELLSKHERRLSYKATQGALLIFLYRDEPILNLPFRFLTLLTDIDSNLMTWRHRHTAMVQRMIGIKIGSGGSSGYHYLRTTMSDRYKVFLDLSNLSTFLIPLNSLPALPTRVAKLMGFVEEVAPNLAASGSYSSH